jgi:hypothetical protein
MIKRLRNVFVYLPVDSIHKSMFCVWRHFKTREQLTKKVMLQGCNESRLKSSFRKFYGRFNDLVRNYKLLLAHMLNDLFYTFC